MHATKQQQIMGFFIEEAKEHLDTIEQGLLDLNVTMSDAEQLNELFRAAHSVKGGAAMLGFNSIQRVGHHLEDCFKIIKDNPIKPDRHLEDLFLKAFDVLKELVEALQSPYGFQESQGEQIVQASQPVFSALEQYLDQLMNVGPGAAAPAPVKMNPNTAALVPAALKKMLQLFKQGDSAACREQITILCGRMAQLTTSTEWQTLLQLSQTAIANPRHSYQVLAPLVIKELKLAGDLLVAGRSGEIVPSAALQQLAGSVVKPPAAPSVSPAPAPVTAAAPAKIQSMADVSQNGRSAQQVTIPLEPRAAARVLLDTFNKKQLIELADFIMKAIQ